MFLIFLVSFSFAQNLAIGQRLRIFQVVKFSSFLFKIDYANMSDDNIQKFV
jgi:hypothetical protein